MKLSTLSACLLLLSFGTSTGCAARHIGRVELLVDPRFIVGPVHLEGCNLNREPPTCQKVKLKYQKGSEQIVSK